MEKRFDETTLSSAELDNVTGGVTGMVVAVQPVAIDYKLGYKVDYKLPEYKTPWK